MKLCRKQHLARLPSEDLMRPGLGALDGAEDETSDSFEFSSYGETAAQAQRRRQRKTQRGIMLRKFGFLGPMAIFLCFALDLAWATPSTPGAKIFFADLKDGETVKSPFTVHFGISGMSLAPAGTSTPGTGHHHLLINAKIEGEALKQPIPLDAQHLHFGKAQTEATLTLPPGKYTLQLVLGDGMHVPLDPPVMSAPVNITVE